MNEENMSAEMAEEVIPETDLAVFDDGWSENAPDEGDFDLNDSAEADEEKAEADTAADTEAAPDEGADKEPAAEKATDTEATADKPEEGSKSNEGHQLYTLKSPAGEKQCTLDEVLTLANKGLDYDGMRQDRDRLREYEGFLKELAAPSGYSVQELIDTTRARMLIGQKKAEGVEMSEMDALTAIQRDKAAAAEAEQNHAAAQKEAAKQNMVSAFLAEFPDVNAADIPQEVWDKCRETGDLAGAYRKYAAAQKDSEISRLREELETLKQNQKNKDRSTGSRKSVGSTTPKDPFDEGWDSV